MNSKERKLKRRARESQDKRKILTRKSILVSTKAAVKELMETLRLMKWMISMF